MSNLYYDEHQEEFEAVTAALKAEMIRIFGESIEKSQHDLNNPEHYSIYFEEMQYTFHPESLNKLDPSLALDKLKVAAFVAKSRQYKSGIFTRNHEDRRWIRALVKPFEGTDAKNICWIDVASVTQFGSESRFDDQLYLTVTTTGGKIYRVSEYLLPTLLIEDGYTELLNAL